MLFALTRCFLNESRSRGRKISWRVERAGLAWWWMNESSSAFAKECSADDERREYIKIISAFARIVCSNKTSPLPYVHVVYSQKVFTIITHFPSFTSSWRAIGTKTSWLAVLVLAHCCFGFQPTKRVSPMVKSVFMPVVKNQRCWMVALVEILCARLRGFYFI